MDVFFRVFTKLFLWFIFYVFILVYVVLGYRYHYNVGLIRYNSTFSLYFPVKTGKVLINGEIYRFINNKLDFYSVYKGYYGILYKGNKIRFLISDDDYREFFIFSKINIEPLNNLELNFNSCETVKYNKVVNIICGKDIKMYFEKIGNNFFVCDNKYKNCRYIFSFSGIFLGYKGFSIYFLSGQKFYRLNFK